MEGKGSEVMNTDRSSNDEETRKRALSAAKIIRFSGMIGTPVVFVIAFLVLSNSPTGLTSGTLQMIGLIFLAVTVADELLMYFVVYPALTRPWVDAHDRSEPGLGLGTGTPPVRDVDRNRGDR